jgi:hypothetical protein
MPRRMDEQETAREDGPLDPTVYWVVWPVFALIVFGPLVYKIIWHFLS